LEDEDDETRDRTTIVISILEDAMEKNPYLPPAEDVPIEDIPADRPVEDDSAAFILLDGLPMSFDKLHRSLNMYKASPGAMSSAEPISLSTLPIVEDSIQDSATTSNSLEGVDEAGMMAGSGNLGPNIVKEVVDPAAVIYAIPELAFLGRAFRSCTPIPLTENETEYVVSCTKHVFESHIVLQFNVTNTIDDQRLENVKVVLENDGGVFDVAGEIVAPSIKYGESGNCFSLLQRNMDSVLEPSAFMCTLHFNVVQVDPSSGEDEGEPFDEEYPLEELEISTSDYMAKVTVSDFRKAWETMGNANEVLEKFALQFKSLEDAVSTIISILGMQACDGTGIVKDSTGGKPHMLHLSGVFLGGKSVLARAQVAMQGSSGNVLLKIAIRSDEENISRLIADCISS
jgi:coatomer protein complex subunit gamma